MFVTVVHRIHDLERFQAAEERALDAGLPSHVGFPIHVATDGDTGERLMLGLLTERAA